MKNSTAFIMCLTARFVRFFLLSCFSLVIFQVFAEEMVCFSAPCPDLPNHAEFSSQSAFYAVSGKFDFMPKRDVGDGSSDLDQKFLKVIFIPDQVIKDKALEEPVQFLLAVETAMSSIPASDYSSDDVFVDWLSLIKNMAKQDKPLPFF